MKDEKLQQMDLRACRVHTATHTQKPQKKKSSGNFFTAWGDPRKTAKYVIFFFSVTIFDVTRHWTEDIILSAEGISMTHVFQVSWRDAEMAGN